ncbi:S8 family serine peptidase [Candidatus Parcubacteria bacterium]|nr:S8 family serine peptidase [Candidatus Parcubacteria bacterium]
MKNNNFIKNNINICIFFLLFCFIFIFFVNISFAKETSDLYYSYQWYLKKIRANYAWDKVTDSNTIIAILDSGVQLDHPDLAENIWENLDEIPGNGIDDDRNGYIDDVNGWNFVDNNSNPSYEIESDSTESGVMHGTIVAGIAAAIGNNNIGVSGVAWKARIMPLRILNGNGEGDVRNVIKAINYAVDNGASVINFSFVGFSYSKKLEYAIRRAYDNNVIMVAAAGNEKKNGYSYFLDEDPMYPVCHDGNLNENMVIGVAATDAMDQKMDFSAYGTKCIDLSAPGNSIFNTVVFDKDNVDFNKYYDGYWSGTSMAVPQVSGAIALIESVNPGLTRDELVDILISSADNITRLNPEYLWQLGNGRLNVEKAVNKAYAKRFDSNFNILVSPRNDYKSQVKLLNKKGEKQNDFLAFNEFFMGGVTVSAGDINGNGKDEIVVGAGNGGGPHVRIFDKKGNVKGQFFAYANNFRGGVNVAVGDIDGDGIDEIVTGAGNGGGPHVRIFDKKGIVKSQFFGFDKNLRNGINVALINIIGGIRSAGKEIAVAPLSNGTGEVKILDKNGKQLRKFYAFSRNFDGGIQIEGVDIDQDGLDEIVVAAGAGGTPHVRIMEVDGSLISSFYVFEAEYSGGINISKILN